MYTIIFVTYSSVKLGGKKQNAPRNFKTESAVARVQGLVEPQSQVKCGFLWRWVIWGQNFWWGLERTSWSSGYRRTSRENQKYHQKAAKDLSTFLLLPPFLAPSGLVFIFSYISADSTLFTLRECVTVPTCSWMVARAFTVRRLTLKMKSVTCTQEEDPHFGLECWRIKKIISWGC